MSLFLSKTLTSIQLIKENIKPSFPRKRESRKIRIDSCFRRNDRSYRIFPQQTVFNFGFTLLEVLIAVAILSIVLAAIYSTFFLSHKAIEGMDESMVKLQESRRALDILKRELDSAIFIGDDNSTLFKMQDRDVFGKQTSQLSFTTFSILRPSLSRIIYYIEDKAGKLNLYKKVESPYSHEETEGVDILEDLEDFTAEAEYNDKWVKTWDTDITKGIPDEIRISLSVMVKGRKVTLSDLSKPMVGKTI